VLGMVTKTAPDQEGYNCSKLNFIDLLSFYLHHGGLFSDNI